MWIRQVFDLDLDDYRPLTEPIPDTDPRYEELKTISREALREAGRRDRGETD